MTTHLNRREFLKTMGAGAVGLSLLGGGGAAGAPAVARRRPPNILFVSVDQMSIRALSGHGCTHVATPNIDRLIQSGVSFRQSYSANPVCCPARSGWFSGRPSSETGAPGSVHLRPALPDLGQWLGGRGYEAAYAGKWHITGHDVAKSFQLLTPASGLGENTDGEVSRAAEGFLRNYSGQKPFFLNLGFLQPHDICYWTMRYGTDIGELPIPEIAGELPPLPANFRYDTHEPAYLSRGKIDQTSKRGKVWSELHWRYYLWSYYRHCEMVDAEIGRVLDTLEDSDFARNTVVIFSSDHGEGMACHQMTSKGYLYDEAAAVPFVVSWPGELPEGRLDTTTLVSGFDYAPTVCDFAGIETMPKARGCSLRPVLEGRGAPERRFIAAESMNYGLMIRTADHKYICYEKDPVCQLFDMKNDPGETRNLAGQTQHASALEEMKKLQAEWESRLEKYPGAPVANMGGPRPGMRGALRRRGPGRQRPVRKAGSV